MVHRGPEHLPFLTDIGLLGRVLDNLIVNAIKHTPRNGTVTVDVIHQATEQALTIRVIDTGEGIPAKDRENLFRKYGRVEGQAMGRSYDTGLGLVFCRMAIDLLGGGISVLSEVGRGSTSSSR